MREGGLAISPMLPRGRRCSLPSQWEAQPFESMLLLKSTDSHFFPCAFGARIPARAPASISFQEQEGRVEDGLLAGRGAPGPLELGEGPPELGEGSLELGEGPPDPWSWEKGLEQSAPHSRAQTELACSPRSRTRGSRAERPSVLSFLGAA